jgi:hypothetical protein
MTSDSNHVRDEEIVTVRGEEPADASGQQGSDRADTADTTDQADTREAENQADTRDAGDQADTRDAAEGIDTRDAADRSDVAAGPSGAADTGVMMDSRDTGTADVADVPAPSGATDTGTMMDSHDTGTADRTDVGEADADEPDR